MSDELLTDEEIQTIKNRLTTPGSQGHRRFNKRERE